MGKDKREVICGIYCIKNKINEKMYFGQSIDIYKRWVQHKSLSGENGDHTHIHNAIRKWGIQNFEFKIIERCPKEKLDERQVYYISKYDTCNSGYNTSPGNQKKESEYFAENKQVLKDRGGIAVRQYDKNKHLINTYDSVAQASRLTSIGNSCINRCLRGEQFYAGGYIWIKESDALDPEKLKERLERKPKEKSKPVSQFTLEGKLVASYNGIVDAGEKTGIPIAGIGMCARNRCKTYHGYIWIFTDNIEKELVYKVKHLSDSPQNITVCKISLKGKILGSYKNGCEAAESESISPSCIRACATGKRMVSQGFIWLYDEGDIPISEKIQQRLKDIEADKIIKKENSKKSGIRREIEQYNSDGTFISKYCSSYQAAKETGISGSQITTCANGERPLGRGFIWVWSDDSNKECILKKKVNDAKIPRRRGRKRAVVQCDLNGRKLNKFESIKDAHDKTGSSMAGIISCVNRHGAISGGYLWFDANDKDLERHIKETVEKISSVNNPASDSIPVVQLTLDEKYVAEFSSIADASRESNVCKSCIDDTLRGKQHTCGGYKWKYASDYYNQINKEKENKDEV